MKNAIVVQKENAYFLWTDEICAENVGIIWDKKYAELIEKALNYYKYHNEGRDE